MLERINRTRSPEDAIIHIDRKRPHDRIGSDEPALKRKTDPGEGFQSIRTAKATLKGVEAVRTIKRGHVQNSPDGVTGELLFRMNFFGLAA